MRSNSAIASSSRLRFRYSAPSPLREVQSSGSSVTAVRNAFSASSRRPSRNRARPRSRHARLCRASSATAFSASPSAPSNRSWLELIIASTTWAGAVRLVQRERDAGLFAGPRGERRVLQVVLELPHSTPRPASPEPPDPSGCAVTTDDSRPIAWSTFGCLSNRSSSARACASGARVRSRRTNAIAATATDEPRPQPATQRHRRRGVRLTREAGPGRARARRTAGRP